MKTLRATKNPSIGQLAEKPQPKLTRSPHGSVLRLELPSWQCAIEGTRQGLATIELVLFFPILLFLGVMMFSLGWANLQKSSTAIRSRQEAWDKRDPLTATRVLQRKELNQNQKKQRVTRTVKVPKFASFITEREAVSQNALVMNPWTDKNRHVGYNKSVGGIRPHEIPLRNLAKSQGVDWLAQGTYQLVNRFDSMLSGLERLKIAGDAYNRYLEASAIQLTATSAASIKYWIESGAFALFPLFLAHSGYLVETAFERRSFLPGPFFDYLERWQPN